MSIISIIRVLTDDQLMYQRYEFHLFLEKTLQFVVVLLIVIFKTCQVLVCRYEETVTHLIL